MRASTSREARAYRRAVLAASVGLAACRGAPARVVAPSPVAATAPIVIAGAPDGPELLRAAQARAIEAGAGPLSVVAAGEASERERLGAFVEIPEGICLLGYARAGSSVDDLDLAAFTDDGTPVAVDDAPDAHPTLLLCPPHPSRVYLAAVVASGEGLVAVGAELVPVALAAAVGKAMDAHGTRAASSRAAEAWPGLDDHVRRHHDAIGGTWEVFRKVAVAVDARAAADVALPLEPDGCTDALVVPDDDVGGLEVEALDERGRLVARGAAGERDRALTVCAPAGFSGTLSVRPHVGTGLVAVVLSRARADVAKGLATSPDIAWAAATEPVDRARAGLDADLRRAGYGAAAGTAMGKLVLGSSRSLPVALGKPGAEACARLDVLGGAPTALLSASAWDDGGRLLSFAEGAKGVTLFACGGGGLRVDVEAHARPGPFALVWRPEPWTDGAFAAHPVAAARMLTRAAWGPVLAGANGSVRAFHVDAGHEVGWTETIPAGTCARVVAGAEGDGAGLVLRAFDVADGDELDRGHASSAVAVRACAEGSPRPVRVSLAVTGGKLDVVVGERLVR
jgi:hypothetical protein